MGLVAGSLSSPYGAAIWSGSGAIALPNPFPTPLSHTRVFGVNDAGHVVGRWEDRSASYGILWRDGQANVLDFPEAAILSANGINNQGWVVGTAQWRDAGYVAPFLLRDGQLTNLVGPELGDWAEARFVNNAGQVVGLSDMYHDPGATMTRRRWWIWDDGRFIDLPALPGTDGPFSVQVLGLNDRGEAVGTSNMRAVLWKNGQVYDLNDLIEPGSGWTLNSANGINDLGQIVGSAQIDGQAFPYILNLVQNPEPSSAGILLLAGAGLLLRRRSCTI